jgi:hypothetical protein
MPPGVDWLPLVLLTAPAIFTRGVLPAWVFMWVPAFSLFFGCKWLTWRRSMRQIGGASRLLSLGYLFTWVGTDARGFLGGGRDMPPPRRREWVRAAAMILLGVFLTWCVARRAIGARPGAAGWIGMVGIILILHFGLFQVMALGWQSAGVNAQPLMREPLRSVSLAEFWGRRWNGAFHALVNDFAFRPLARKCGVTVAMLLVFLISGLIHDLVISLPARGGYGLPTAYFLMQGVGLVFERTVLGKRLGLGRG